MEVCDPRDQEEVSGWPSQRGAQEAGPLSLTSQWRVLSSQVPSAAGGVLAQA